MFLAYAMVQQIMTEFSGAVTEKEKVTVITKASKAGLRGQKTVA
jgi:hypothetical protein